MTAVTEQLTRRGIPFQVITHPQAFTTLSEALALGIPADELLKTVVLHTEEGHAIAVIPGSRRLDMRRVHLAIADPHARLASEDEIARDFPGMELGAMPPMGSLMGVPALVDPEVMTHETVVFAAGTQAESVKCRLDDLFKDEEIRVVPITRHPEEEVG